MVWGIAKCRFIFSNHQMKTRVSAYGLAMTDTHILLTQLADRCYRPRHWTFPGGGMNHGELPEDTLVREFFEETGLKASALDLFHVHAFSEDERGLYMGVQIIYKVHAEGEPQVQEVGGTTAACEWVALDELSARKRVPVLDVVLKKLKLL